jgi:hypothetical protein
MSKEVALIPNAKPPSPYEIALLPWEDAGAFGVLREEYFIAYPPGGPADRHILEQLVWCDWRRRRLVLGERALQMAGIDKRVDFGPSDPLTRRALMPLGAKQAKFSSEVAVTTTMADDEDLAVDTSDDEAHAADALSILEAGRPDAYEQALAALRDDSREFWINNGTGDDPQSYPPNAEGLANFIRRELMPLLEQQKTEATMRQAVRVQAWGESLDPNYMDRLMQLDERLTRQYEKLLGMLDRARDSSASKTPNRTANKLR